jgi:NAD+ synthase
MIELPKLNTEEEAGNIIRFLLKLVPKDKKCILGLSGGIDSTVVAYLLTTALGKDRVLGVMMPYGENWEKSDSFRDALSVTMTLKISSKIVNITDIVDSYFKGVEEEDITNIRKGNIMSRVRMTMLYDTANVHNGIVIGTTNHSELMIGYFTKHGDGGVDLEPIGGLLKTHVYELARYLGVPENIINKTPTADLWAGQTDEDEIGITYEELDKILYCARHDMIDEATKEFGNKVEKVCMLIIQSIHKRRLAPMYFKTMAVKLYGD